MLSSGSGDKEQRRCGSRTGGGGGGSSNNNRSTSSSRERRESRREREDRLEEDRNALFAAAGSSSSRRPGRRPSASNSSSGRAVNEERYGREIVKDRRDDPRFLRDELQSQQKASVDVTRNMIRLLQESTEVSESSLNQLNRQGESLNRSELKALATNVNAKQAREEARDLKKYSKIFAISWPSWTKSRQRKELERAEKALKEGERQRMEEEMAMRQEERERLNERAEAERDQLVGSIEEHSLFNNNDRQVRRINRDGDGASGSGSSRRRNFANDQDNENWERGEGELDQNLNEISSLLSNLKVNAASMGAKISDQTRQIERINQSADNTSATLGYTKKALRKI